MDDETSWCDAEKNFWAQFNKEQDALEQKLETDYQEESQKIRSDIDTLSNKQSQLTQSKDQLASELGTVEVELQSAVTSHTDKAARLAQLERDFRKNDQERLVKRERIKNAMQRWFRQQHNEVSQVSLPSPVSANDVQMSSPDDLSPAAEMTDPFSDDDESPMHTRTSRNYREDSFSSHGEASPGPAWRAARNKSSKSSAANTQQQYSLTSSINKSNLLIKHNETVYTSPPCIEGVPLEKIYPGHPYWEPEWPDPLPIIRATLDKYRKKYDDALSEEARTGIDVPGKAQLLQQVTRGRKNVEFIENGEICIYQLLAKEYIFAGPRRSLASHQTMFRLGETLNELAKYNLDVKPVDWLRQRLHEIIQEKGSKFSLSQTLSQMYPDEKLAALRTQAGFKNTGRPSGYKMPSHPKKRKGSSSHASHGANGDTPRKLRQLRASHINASTTSAQYDELNPADDEVLSETDSYSGAKIGEHEWRIYQVKTRVNTTSEEVTQYWAWFPKQQRFEHQVIKETDPVEWGVFKEPLNFNMRSRDIIDITWNVDSLRAHLRMTDSKRSTHDNKPRGDIMVAFKRSTTMMRFLRFCQSQEIPIVKKPA